MFFNFYLILIGMEYLIALPSNNYEPFVTGAAGLKPGSLQIQYPNLDKNYTFDVGPLSRQKYTVLKTSLASSGVESKAILISTSHDEVSVYVHYGYAAFSPIPVSALGTKYVLPSCGTYSGLFFATSHNDTIITVTFRLKKPMTHQEKTYYDGDILTVTLQEYEVFTFPFRFDITGTTVKSSEPIAVFLGNFYNNYAISYDQVLPVNAHGQEYVVAVDDSTTTYQLQIISDYSDNEIVFNNGSIVNSQFYYRQLDANSTLYFNTTRPAMTTLCRVATYQSVFLTVPSISTYGSRDVSIYPPTGVAYTMKILVDQSTDVNVMRYFDPEMLVSWTDIGNSSYKVGTCQVPALYSTMLTSGGNFTFLAFDKNLATNGGYEFQGSMDQGKRIM